MALVDVAHGELNRRAESRSMTFLHSSEWDKANAGTVRTWGKPGQESRMDSFVSAASAHEKGINRGIRQQKIPARGIAAENISPKTPLQRKQYGSNN